MKWYSYKTLLGDRSNHLQTPGFSPRAIAAAQMVANMVEAEIAPPIVQSFGASKSSSPPRRVGQREKEYSDQFFLAEQNSQSYMRPHFGQSVCWYHAMPARGSKYHVCGGRPSALESCGVATSFCFFMHRLLHVPLFQHLVFRAQPPPPNPTHRPNPPHRPPPTHPHPHPPVRTHPQIAHVDFSLGLSGRRGISGPQPGCRAGLVLIFFLHRLLHVSLFQLVFRRLLVHNLVLFFYAQAAACFVSIPTSIPQ